MNRVWTALLLLATVVVAVAVGYVVVHKDPVPQVGQTPGYSASAPAAASADSSPGTGVPTSTGTTGSPASSSTSDSSSAGPSNSGGSTSTTVSHIAFLGDNWTLGVGISDRSQHFPQLVDKGLGIRRPATIVAKDGVGYAKQVDGQSYRELVDKVIAAKPDLVVVTGGRNDRSDDPETLKAAAKSVFQKLHSALPDATLVAVAPFFGDSGRPSDLAMVGDAAKAGVEAAGGTYLDIPDPILGHPEWMADSANPNAKGDKAIADALIAKLRALTGA